MATNNFDINTPLGVINIKDKACDEYPGVYIDFMWGNDKIPIADVEFDKDKGVIQVIVRASRGDEPSHVVEIPFTKTFPLAQIEYLGTDGKVQETQSFFDWDDFKAHAIAADECGEPQVLKIYDRENTNPDLSWLRDCLCSSNTNVKFEV